MQCSLHKSHRPSPAVHGTKRALAVEDEWTWILSPVDSGFISVMFFCFAWCLVWRTFLSFVFHNISRPQLALRMLVLPAHQLLIHGVSNAALMLSTGLPVEQRNLVSAKGEGSRCQGFIYAKNNSKALKPKLFWYNIFFGKDDGELSERKSGHPESCAEARARGAQT